VFYYETPTSGAENAGLGLLEAVYSDLMVEVTTGHLYIRREEESLHVEDTILDANWDASTPIQRIISPRRLPRLKQLMHGAINAQCLLTYDSVTFAIIITV